MPQLSLVMFKLGVAVGVVDASAALLVVVTEGLGAQSEERGRR